MPTFDDYKARQAARAARYAEANPLREAAFRFAEAQVAAGGVTGVTFTLFDGDVRAAYDTWRASPDRGRGWPWPSLVEEFRADDPACFEAAIWRERLLCGLAVGAGMETTAEAPGFVALDYLERTPHATNPLRGRLLAVAVTALLAYAVALDRPSVRLVRPNQYARASAARTGVPFVFVDNPGQRPYLLLHG